MEAALRTFFTSPRFAVVGASSDPTKYGHKGTRDHSLRSLEPLPQLMPMMLTVMLSVRLVSQPRIARRSYQSAGFRNHDKPKENLHHRLSVEANRPR